MELKRIDRKTRVGAAGALGLVAAACVACCAGLPLLVPLLAWLGIAGLGAAVTGWYLAAGGIFAAGVGATLYVRHRRWAAKSRHAHGCGCATRCRT